MSKRHGFALVTVLIITAVGLLFGAGALLLFRYQCQLRIDQQHEYEKIYAVRSALNWIAKMGRTDFKGSLSSGGIHFYYHTGSDRELDIHVNPVAQRFPVLSNENHLDFCYESSDNGRLFNTKTAQNNYCVSLDYEYGSIGLTNVQDVIVNEKRSVDKESVYSLVFTGYSEEVSPAVRWVNIGMKNTEGWLHEEYGRRYSFKPVDFAKQSSVGGNGDILRLCLVRTNQTPKVGREWDGRRFGWPLQNGERALVFQIRNENNQYRMEFEEWICQKEGTNIVSLCSEKCPDKVYMGFQIAHSIASLFYVDWNQDRKDALGYEFLGSTNITEMTLKYFMKDAVMKDDAGHKIIYDGESEIDPNFKVIQSSDLRAIFEVVSFSQIGENSLTEFKVTPAYQYDVFIVRPELAYKDQTGKMCYELVTNLATVAQKSGKTIKKSGLGGGRLTSSATMLTYDTHGTENRGFRKDEREAERRRNGQ